ncbi:heavy metal translocating P-type ATPase [Gloeothece verrucosa]|uniref:P-type Zn(2+) transporter n=1 Tax=Gloeothece verrucosa (strain PCC 7822) TaxID=497965 RepID=E0UHK4_GLOV7|nr:heavy metal translocating P-type ATPase [Gloeothece verrucosa]ADN12145.1 cadmium-translocating P-type ATPase [Gloeothece verrucosa PCC 7822]
MSSKVNSSGCCGGDHDHDPEPHHAHKHDHDHDHSHGDGDFNLKKELTYLLFIAILFIFGFTFEDTLHNSYYGIAEYGIFITAYLLSGWNVLKTAGRNILRGRFFDENFLMTIATLGAIAIHKLPEAVGVMLFYKIGEFFQELAVSRSRKSIKSLLEIRPDSANLKIDDTVQKVSPETVKIGSLILVKPGEKIPLDGEIIEGNSQINTSALTGESVPRTVRVGETVLAGMVNETGLLTIKVTKPFAESSISRILDLVENAGSKKAPTQKFITKFAQYYTPIVVFTSLAVAFIPPLFLEHGTHNEWVYRALILLVISCPCGLVISIPLGYFGGVGGAARRGVLVKGAMYLDTLTQVKTIVFDKTGTLTEGVFQVTEIVPKNGFTPTELLTLASRVESNSNHPIAQAIIQAYGKDIDGNVQDYQELAGYGIRAIVNNQVVIAGNDKLLHRENIEHDTCQVQGTVVHVAVDNCYAGYILIADSLKEDAAEAIEQLKKLGIEKTVMLTGDSKVVAENIARQLGLNSYKAELLPEEKLEALEQLIGETAGKKKLAFVGDGINDAPVIARADVGIAMGGLGSDAAIETADVVIMNDAPSKVAEAIKVARKTHQIVWQNIIFALLVKGLFIVLGAMGLATMWEAVFADVGVALVAIFNASRVLKIS